MTDAVILTVSAAVSVIALSLTMIVRWSLAFARAEEQADVDVDSEIEIDTDGLDSQALHQAADLLVKQGPRDLEQARRFSLRALELRLLAQRRAVEERALVLQQSRQKIWNEGYEAAKSVEKRVSLGVDIGVALAKEKRELAARTLVSLAGDPEPLAETLERVGQQIKGNR